MSHIDEALWKMLEVNLAYKPGETVGLVQQEWDDSFDKEYRERFESSRKIINRMIKVYEDKGVDVEVFKYVPSAPRNGVDVPKMIYDKIGFKDILIMPTAFSLTWTKFRIEQAKKGSRIASCSGLTLEMFEQGGPMDVNYENVERMTLAMADNLRNNRYAHITGDGTDIWVEVNKTLVHTSTGMPTSKGQTENIPGAEAYCIPVFEGDTNGHITVPKGWGGQKKLEHKAKLIIKNGRFVDIVGENDEAQEWLERNVRTVFDGENYDVLAELGIGTNPAIDEEYIENHEWRILTAEKVFGSAHFANGNSAAMGGENDVPVHVDWVVPNVDIEFSDEKS